jgi:hypothetical protein
MKYYLVKWHFFWNAVWNGEVTGPKKVDRLCCLHQGVDYLTEGLAREAFEQICKINQGW